MTRSARRAAGLIAVSGGVTLVAAPAAFAATPSVDIHSAGPLSDIYIGNDLGCQVRSGGFSSTEFFPNANGPGDCGTFYYMGSGPQRVGLLGPDFANHAGGTDTTLLLRRKCLSRRSANRWPGRAQRQPIRGHDRRVSADPFASNPASFSR